MPNPKPTPKPDPPTQQLREVDLTEFLAKVYNRNAPNFTADIVSFVDDDSEKSKFVYDAKVGYRSVTEFDETVYADGLIYRRRLQAVPSDKAEWYATESDAFFEFKTIKQRNLEAILELLLPYLGIDVENRVEISGSEYVLKIKKDKAEKLNGLLAIAKENIDEKAVVGVTKAWNYLVGSELTQEEFETLFVFYGDSTFEELLKAGKPMSEEAFAGIYGLIRSLLDDSYKLPSFEELKQNCKDLTLSGIFGLGSAEDMVAVWKEQTLRDRLRNYPYTGGTVADFVASDAPTEFTRAETITEIRADASFALTAASFEETTEAKDAPVFTASLNGIKTEIKNYSRRVGTKSTFGSVGVSVVEVPEEFVFVGEEHLTVDCAGKYTVRRGTANIPAQNIGVTADGGEGVGGEDLNNSKEWVELLKRIADGLSLDNEAGTISVSVDCYESMKRAVLGGLTALKVKAYEEFDLIITVE